MSKKINQILILVSSALLLGSCSNDSTSESSSSSEEVIEPVSPIYSDINSFYKSISKARNFTVQTDIKKGSSLKQYFDYFTNTYVYCDFEGDETGFAYKDGKVFRVDKNTETNKFTASDEYLDETGKSYASIWDSGLISSPVLDATYLSKGEGVTTLDITSKNLKLQYLRFLKIDETMLSEISSFSTYIENNLASIKATISKTTYTSTFYSFNVTSNDEVEEFLASNGAATLDPMLLRAKSDFATNNFTHVHRENLTYEENNKLTGYESFLPGYYYDFYTKASDYSIYSKGYISLHNKEYINEDGTKTSFDGAYLFYLNDDRSAVKSILSAGPAFVTKIYDMPSIMDYPSKMEMWDHNLQYFSPTSDNRFKGTGFTTEDGLILTSFYKNSQLENSLVAILGSLSSLQLNRLDMFIEQGTTISEDKITFLFNVVANGATYDCVYEYIDFNNSEIEAVDEFAAKFVDKE